MTQEFDVIVIGAGPAGSASSFFLSQAGIKVLLLDKAIFPRDKTCGDALSNRALKIIDEMGGFQQIKSFGKSISTVKFFPPNGKSVSIPIPHFDEYGTYVIPRFLLDNILKELSKSAGTTVLEDFKVDSVNYEKEHVTVKGKNGVYHSKLVIFATGANTQLIRKMGILNHPPKIMHASRTYFEGVGNLDEIIFSYDFSALPSYGWIFPLPDGRANVGAGFYRTKFNKNRLPSNSKQTLIEYLALPSINNILGNAKKISDIKGFPLRVDYLSAPKITKRGFLVGEAAGLVSPITGEGIDYALESGLLASNHIVKMFTENNFSSEKVQEYAKILDNNYRNHFMQYQWMRDTIFSSSSLINLVMQKARKNQKYGEKLLNVSLRNIPPHNILF